MNDAFPKIIKNAEMAKLVWANLPKGKGKERINKFFHLRPTNSGITIVTTLSGYEMRGVTKRGPGDLRKALYDMADSYPVLVSLNDVKKNLIMSKLGFVKRGSSPEGPETPLEEFIQAMMINSMSDDLGLARALGVQKIQFIASELIFEKGPYRVDIVGFDGSDLFFFELKKERTTKIGQVSEYIDYYNEAKNSDILRRILRTYPINPVNEYRTIRGVMIMKSAENSETRSSWIDKQKEHGVDILFYRHSLSYNKSQ